MKIEQTLNEKDYREAYSIFYSSYNTWMRARMKIGPLLIVLGLVIYWIQLFDPAMNMLFELFFPIYGLFMIASKPLYIWKALKASKTSKSFGKPMSAEITPDGKLKRESGGDSSVVELRNLYGYRAAPAGILLYLQKNLFVFLKRAAIDEAGGMDLLLLMLHEQGVERLR